MNEASRWRLELARAIARKYALNPRVAAVEIGGSVARGHADRYSDLELGVCWSEAPRPEERLDVVDRLGGILGTIYPRDPDAGEWAEDYAVHRLGDPARGPAPRGGAAATLAGERRAPPGAVRPDAGRDLRSVPLMLL